MPKVRLAPEDEGRYSRWLSRVKSLNRRYTSFKLSNEPSLKHNPKLPSNIKVTYTCKPCDLTFQNLDLYEIHLALRHSKALYFIIIISPWNWISTPIFVLSVFSLVLISIFLTILSGISLRGFVRFLLATGFIFVAVQILFPSLGLSFGALYTAESFAFGFIIALLGLMLTLVILRPKGSSGRSSNPSGGGK